MFSDYVYPKFRGKAIVPTKEAAYELARLNLLLEDILDILENGFDCSTSRRKKGIVERAIQHGKHLFKAVVVEKPDRFLLIHVGRLTFSKSLKKRFRNRK